MFKAGIEAILDMWRILLVGGVVFSFITALNLVEFQKGFINCAEKAISEQSAGKNEALESLNKYVGAASKVRIILDSF
ncbi:hypothetical protein [Maridesulfovibrio sp.]|uniref:hypothetical protein n=1 Tax=Maridesulfovibrio sp. TaxID=2795000 RepID=UPI002AA8C24F|nr:hypothetical protein [Maridesulfovibrio sp.]